MSANAKQVGGDHYKNSFQHWDFVVKYHLGYIEGCSTNYITRWPKKNGAQDVEKALHYAEKLYEISGAGYKNHCTATLDACNQFCASNGMGKLETTIFYHLCCWKDRQDILRAVAWLKELLEYARLRKPVVLLETEKTALVEDENGVSVVSKEEI